MMLARASCVILALMLLPSVAAVPEVEVPTQVWGTDVAFKVDGFDPDAKNVTFKLGSGTTAKTALVNVTTASYVFHVFSGVPVGKQDWRVEVRNITGDVELFKGTLFVSDPFSQLAALEAKVVDLNTSLTTLAAATGNANGTAALAELKVAVARIQSDLTALNVSALLADDSEPALATTSSSVSPVTTVGATASALLAIGILVVVVVIQWQAARRHQEQMVLILAMAARMNVGPDSAEFQTALAALG